MHDLARRGRAALLRAGMLVVSMTTALVSWSQPYTSQLGRFQVDNVLGCAPFTVTIKRTDLTPGHDCATQTCQMTFEPTVIEQNTFSYTYTTPGTYNLMVLYPSTIGEAADQITITVLPNIPPDFEIYSCSGNGVSIKITDKTYDKYILDFGDGSPTIPIASGNNPTAQHTYASSSAFNISLTGIKNNAANNCFPNIQTFNALLVLPAPFVTTLTALDVASLRLDFTSAPHLELQLQIAVNDTGPFQQLQTLYGVSTTQVSGLDLTKNYYCFRLNAHDPCTGNDTPSNIICSQKFTAGAVSDDDALAWTTGAGVPDFTISRNGAFLVTIGGDSYDDRSIVCNTSYCYQITSNYADGSSSISLMQCVTSFSSRIPTLINNSSAVVNTGGVELMWLQDPAYATAQYRVFRRAGNDAFQFLSYSDSMSYHDATYTTDGDFCYYVNYTDQCKNDSKNGNLICPLRLLGTLDKMNAIHLKWNSYRGWLNGVKNYTLQKFDKTGNLIQTISPYPDTTYVDSQFDTTNQIVSYKVTATPNDALLPSVSNVATFVKEANLFSPTAFTPDHNSLNETFTVRGFFITRLELHIFNRWGTLIFSTDSNKPWDGTFNGRAQPNDTYVWRASITDTAGQHFNKNGTVVLLTVSK